MRSSFHYNRLIEKIDAALEYLTEHRKLNARHHDNLIEILEPIVETINGELSTDTASFSESSVVRELKYKHNAEWSAYRAYFPKLLEKLRENAALDAYDENLLREIAEALDDVATDIIDKVTGPVTVRVK